jgi:hypothetical protein
VGARGKAEVYAQHVAPLVRHVLERGWRPQFWADVALEHPEVFGRIPQGATALAWGYEADSPFERWGRALANRVVDRWVCPGTSSWRSITGRTTERRANLRAAARAGVGWGASGFLVCDWGDVGHLQQWPVALAALAEGADAAWTGGAPGYTAWAASIHAFGEAPDSFGAEIADWLDALGDADEPLRRAAASPKAGDGMPPLRNASALFSVLWPAREEFGRPGALGDAAAWEGVRERLSALASSVPAVTNPLHAREIAHTLAWAACACRVGRAMAGGGESVAALASQVSRDLDGLAASHAALWRHRSREGGLPRSGAFWAEAKQRLERLATRAG